MVVLKFRHVCKIACITFLTQCLQSTLFQDDIFPPTKDDAAVMTAEEWLSGVNRQPHKVSLKGDMKSSVLHVAAVAAQPAASSPAPQQKQFTAPVCDMFFAF